MSKLSTAPAEIVGDQARMLTVMQYGLPVGLVSHAGFLLMFWALEFQVLALFNLFSIAIFALGIQQMWRGNLAFAAYTCILLEVPAHAVLATLYLGFDAGFWLFVFTSVAAIILYPPLTRPGRFLIGFLVVLTVGFVQIIAIKNGSIYEVSSALSAAFLMMNLLVLALVIMIVIASYDVAVERAELAQQQEYERAELLLLNVLPEEIALRLKAREEPLADDHEQVSVLFADIAGFTNLSRTLSAQTLVTLLNDLFTRFDVIGETLGVEKIKTIGDAYMVAMGLQGETAHAQTLVDMAILMQGEFESFRRKHSLNLQLRIGVHTGAVVAGVIGKHKFTYDLWGDTVNVASRMESTGVPGGIQISAETRQLLPPAYVTQSRGEIAIKGHQPRECFLLDIAST